MYRCTVMIQKRSKPLTVTHLHPVTRHQWPHSAPWAKQLWLPRCRARYSWPAKSPRRLGLELLGARKVLEELPDIRMSGTFLHWTIVKNDKTCEHHNFMVSHNLSEFNLGCVATRTWRGRGPRTAGAWDHPKKSGQCWPIIYMQLLRSGNQTWQLMIMFRSLSSIIVI